MSDTRILSIMLLALMSVSAYADDDFAAKLQTQFQNIGSFGKAAALEAYSLKTECAGVVILGILADELVCEFVPKNLRTKLPVRFGAALTSIAAVTVMFPRLRNQIRHRLDKFAGKGEYCPSSATIAGNIYGCDINGLRRVRRRGAYHIISC